MEKTYKILKLVLLALCLVALILGAGFLYKNLSSQMDMIGLSVVTTNAPPEEPVMTAPAETEAPAQTEAPAETEAAPEPAPDFTVYDGEGNAHKLSDFRGKPVILNFWASWCGPCKSEMPDFEEKYLEYGDEIHFLLVNLTDGQQETVETASAFIEKQGYTFPVYFDSAMEGAYAYGVNAVPVTYFLDAEGVFVAWGQGALSASSLQSGIDMLLNN